VVDQVEVGDYVLYCHGKVHWMVEAIQGYVFIIRSGQTGRRASAYARDLQVYRKWNHAELAA
jgi:hypothetical protein